MTVLVSFICYVEEEGYDFILKLKLIFFKIRTIA